MGSDLVLSRRPSGFDRRTPLCRRTPAVPITSVLRTSAPLSPKEKSAYGKRLVDAGDDQEAVKRVKLEILRSDSRVVEEPLCYWATQARKGKDMKAGGRPRRISTAVLDEVVLEVHSKIVNDPLHSYTRDGVIGPLFALTIWPPSQSGPIPFVVD